VGPGESGANGAASVITPDELQAYGPLGLCTRTWLGAHLFGLIGRVSLEQAGAIVSDESWGGVRVDVIEQPWEHEPAELIVPYQRVMKSLRTGGVFGDYARIDHYAHGTKWKPVPVR
jgi:hypothetical protein